MESLIFATGVLAGVLQVFGYGIYFKQVIAHDVFPNGMSWLMWAYGTFVIFFIEFDLSASWTILVLPAFCSLSSLLIAGYSFSRGAYIKPDRIDYLALGIDVMLLLSYVYLVYVAHVSELHKDVYTALILVATSLSTLVTFFPMIRTTYREPANEKASAWIVWTLAYSFLLFTVWHATSSFEYLVYPILNIMLHGVMAILILQNKRLYTTTKIAPKVP